MRNKKYGPQSKKQEAQQGRRVPYYERPRWTPPQLSTEPYPALTCPYCGRLIRDLSLAVIDKNHNLPSHFDCIISSIEEMEPLEKGDSVAYIGKGRFGIVHIYEHSYIRREKPFVIKKIIDWETVSDDRPPWRVLVKEHFSRI